MTLDGGRTRQKLRTRKELLAAARRLIQRNEAVTVASVADEAQISRATAYRYFSQPETLVIEAMLDEAWPTAAEVIGDATEVRARVRRVHAFIFESSRRQEGLFRLYLAKRLEQWVADGGRPQVPLRAKQRVAMFEEALAPARPSIGARAFGELVTMLSMVAGFETFMTLKDVCDVEGAEAERLSWQVVEAILDSYLDRTGNRPLVST